MSEVIVQPGFSFTGSSITLVTGRSGIGDLQLSSLNSFTGNVAVTRNIACGTDQFIVAPSAGTYPITFTATGTDQGGSTPITHDVTLNATLQP